MKAIPCTLTGLGLLLSGVMAGAQESPPRQMALDIESQVMVDALNVWAQQTGLQLIVPDADATNRLAAPRVKGRFTAQGALSQLLAGTPLTYEFVNERTVAIHERLPASLPAPTPAAGKRVDKRFLRLTAAQTDDARRSSDGGATESENRLIPSANARESDNNKRKRGVLEEVIVTAQKRKERLIDVPQAVSVLSPDDLAKSGMVQFRDYAHSVPGLTFRTSGAGETTVSIRGVTLGNDLGPTVGIYVDEVPYGSSSSLTFAPRLAFDAALFDLERIEVLKGPQGTLYGANSMGGLIKYVTKAPSAESFSGQIQAGLAASGDGGMSYNGAATVNAPIVSDKLAVRVTGFYSHDGGYIDNVALGEKDVNRSNIFGGRADLLFTPTEAFSIRLTGFLQNIDRDGMGTADYSLTGASPYGSLAQNRLTAEPFEQRFRLVSGTVLYDLSWAALTSITSYQTGRTEFLNDSSPFWVPLAQRLFGRSYSGASFFNSGPADKFVQEVRLASEGSRPLEWVIGGFYTRETTGVDQRLRLFDVAGNLTQDDLVSISAPSRFEEYAGFGTLTWYLTDKLNVSGGIRYLENREQVVQHGSGLLAVSRPTTRSSESVATYLANARYHFSDQATLYLRYATGYRPGGPNYLLLSPITGRPGPARFESDRLRNYEIGFKAETEDRRFGIDLAAFHLDWDNMILFAFRDGIGFRGNAPGGASVRGLELTLTARPTRGFTVNGAFAYQDAEMSEANADLPAAKGEQLPSVPRFSAALDADYELPVGSLRPRVGATLRYMDERRASFDGSASFPQYRLPDYATVDLRAGLTLGAVDAQLYVRNLFDERGQLSALTFGGPKPAILQPRTIGVSVTTSF